MKFSLFYEMQGVPGKPFLKHYLEHTEEIVLADKLGFTTAWLAELHFNYDFSVLSAPVVFAAALSQKTERIRMGLGIAVLPIHEPVRLAEEVATLDLISNGRVNFGIGRGHPMTGIYEQFGIPISESRERFYENLEIVLKCWSEEEFSFKGRFRSLEKVSVVPKPLQKPHPPVYISAISEESLAFAAQRGYELYLPAQVAPLSQLGGILKHYDDLCQKSGRRLEDLQTALLLPIFVHENRQRALDIFRDPLMRYYQVIHRMLLQMKERYDRQGLPFPEQYKAYETLLPQLEHVDYDFVAKELAVIGTPEEVKEKIQQIQEAMNIKELLCWINVGGISHDDAMQSMTLFAERVMTKF